MTVNIAVVREGEADCEIAKDLADRVLQECIDWLDADLIEHQRCWVVLSAAGVPLTWKKMKELAIKAGIVAMGHFDGEPGQPDALAARRAIRYLRQTFPDLDAAILIRDQDDQPDRRKGLEQARQEHQGTPKVVLGVAIVERECWVLNGFDPADDPERERLEAERRTLGFDPRHKSEQLSACKDDSAKRSPKRVLRQLSLGDADRERRCWVSAPMETLRERGKENGLAAYLQDVKEILVSQIGNTPR